VTDEQPMGGGAAFWAARGVRIEPEVVPDEFDDADEFDEADGADEPLGVEGVVDEETVAAEAGFTDEECAEALGKPESEPEPKSESEPEPEAAPEPEAEPEPEPAVAAQPLPGFPQQRTAAPDATTDAADENAGEPAAEPAWQLTGGALALPLPPLKTCLEAILMVVDEPTSVVSLAQVLEHPTAEVADALIELAEEYTVLGRGFELREVGLAGDGSHTGWRIYSRAECAPVVERFVRDGQQAKLTQAALETLAVVAYRQPVSRSKVSAIRGVNCDGVMRTLLARGLVEEYGNDLETGAVLYQTTGYFLERMGLKTLDDLPDLAPLLPSAAEVDVEDFA
jgi:segregation and condensation protein B